MNYRSICYGTVYPTLFLPGSKLWSTLSYNLLKSKYTISIAFPWSTYLSKKAIWFVWHNMFLTNLCWLLLIALFISKESQIHCLITCFRIFPGTDVKLTRLWFPEVTFFPFKRSESYQLFSSHVVVLQRRMPFFGLQEKVWRFRDILFPTSTSHWDYWDLSSSHNYIIWASHWFQQDLLLTKVFRIGVKFCKHLHVWLAFTPCKLDTALKK